MLMKLKLQIGKEALQDRIKEVMPTMTIPVLKNRKFRIMH